MLGQISTTMAHAGLNIHNMVNKSRGEMAYTLVDVDSPVERGVIAALSAIDGVLSVRAIPAEVVGDLRASDDAQAELRRRVHRLGAVARAERAQHRRQVRLDRALGQRERARDQLVRLAADHAMQHLDLPR